MLHACAAKPFPRSYWVTPGNLLAGCYPGSKQEQRTEEKCEGLFQCGVRRIINLMEEDEKDWSGKSFADYEPTWLKTARRNNTPCSMLRFPIKDRSIPPRSTMRDILDAVDTFLELNEPVYVHCWGGKGRTGTVIGCYLARHGYAAGNKILEMISIRRSSDPTWDEPSPENSLQCDFVRSWQKGK